MCAGRQSPLLARRSRHDVVDPVRGRARWISGQRRTLCPRRLGAAQPCTGRRDDAGGRRDRAGPPGDRHSTRRRRLPVRCRACGPQRRRAGGGAGADHCRQCGSGRARGPVASLGARPFLVGLCRPTSVDLAVFGDVRIVGASVSAWLSKLFDVPAAALDENPVRPAPQRGPSWRRAGRRDAADDRGRLFCHRLRTGRASLSGFRGRRRSAGELDGTRQARPRRQAGAMAASHHRSDRPRIPGLRLACRRFGFQHRAVDAQLSQCARWGDLRFRPAAAVCADLARDRPLGEDTHSRALSCLVIRGQRRFHRGDPCRQQCGGTDSQESCGGPVSRPRSRP